MFKRFKRNFCYIGWRKDGRPNCIGFRKEAACEKRKDARYLVDVHFLVCKTCCERELSKITTQTPKVISHTTAEALAIEPPRINVNCK